MVLKHDCLAPAGPQAHCTASLTSCACCSACAHVWLGGMNMQIVASPVIGKVVMVGTDRTIGTVAGGVTGWLCFLAAYHLTQSHYLWQYAVLCVMVFIFGWSSVVLGW